MPTNRKMGFFDFLSRELDADHEKSKNFTWKEALKVFGVFILLELAIFGLLILIDQYQRYVGSSNPVFGQIMQLQQYYDLQIFFI